MYVYIYSKTKSNFHHEIPNILSEFDVLGAYNLDSLVFILFGLRESYHFQIWTNTVSKKVSLITPLLSVKY